MHNNFRTSYRGAVAAERACSRRLREGVRLAVGESLELEVAVIEGLKQTHDSGVGSGQAAAAWALVHDL